MRDGRPVVPVYVLDDTAAGAWAAGGASRWWLHHSLVAPSCGFGGARCSAGVAAGNAVDVIPELARAVGATEVHTGGSALPWGRRLDRAVADALAAYGVTLKRHRTMMLFNPDTLRTQSGGSYSVFTPFSRACMAHAPPPQPEAAPRRIPTVAPPQIGPAGGMAFAAATSRLGRWPA